MEVTQAVHAETVNSQSPDLAAGFAKLVNAVRPHIDPNKAHEAQQTLSDSGYFTALLEYELAQCSANILPPTDDSSEIDRATYASRRLSLSRCLANIGRHDEALKAVREATKLYRTLAEHNPGTYTPNLARSLNNLAGSQAENGQPHDALQTAQEAVTIRRKLAKHNPAAYTPDLAMSLNNLANRLADNGQHHEALKTAQEATNLYRTLAKQNPAAYTPALTRSLNTYANILERRGKTKEAARIRKERDQVLKRMKETEEGHV